MRSYKETKDRELHLRIRNDVLGMMVIAMLKRVRFPALPRRQNGIRLMWVPPKNLDHPEANDLCSKTVSYLG